MKHPWHPRAKFLGASLPLRHKRAVSVQDTYLRKLRTNLQFESKNADKERHSKSTEMRVLATVEIYEYMIIYIEIKFLSSLYRE